MTERTDVRLSAEPLVEYDKGDWQFGYASVYAHREAHSTRALIDVSHNDLPGIRLTAAEARELANALLILAGTVERA